MRWWMVRSCLDFGMVNWWVAAPATEEFDATVDTAGSTDDPLVSTYCTADVPAAGAPCTAAKPGVGAARTAATDDVPAEVPAVNANVGGVIVCVITVGTVGGVDDVCVQPLPAV